MQLRRIVGSGTATLISAPPSRLHLALQSNISRPATARDGQQTTFCSIFLLARRPSFGPTALRVRPGSQRTKSRSNCSELRRGRLWWGRLSNLELRVREHRMDHLHGGKHTVYED